MGDSRVGFRPFKGSYEPQKRAPFVALAEAVTPDNHYFAPGAMPWKTLTLKGVATEQNQWGNTLKTRENR